MLIDDRRACPKCNSRLRTRKSKGYSYCPGCKQVYTDKNITDMIKYAIPN
jgi:Zn-finger nucleic acid-binding protein